ncbi:Retrotransposon gag protein [Corchorus olitorius]|uniref:Retrotransposon gag protein n=1 Tax=Corchorus olitorius TaxID=93759 RepID=A0A1R3G5U6_9ROSI|nr:Retrotransposon gag protein [Corchorus olitorius]
MQGDALTWFQWMHKNNQLLDWNSFTRALELQFGPSSFQNPQAALFKLKQFGIVAQYQREFEIVANRVSGLTEEHLLNYFVSGLKPNIQTEVVIQCPTTLPHALALAKLIEAKLLAHPGFFNRSSTPNSSLSTPASRLVLPAPPFCPALLAPPPRLALPAPNPHIRRLTPAEMQARRAKYYVLIVMSNINLGTKVVSSPPLSAIPLPPPPEAFDQTGIINGHTFTVLIDSGSSDNLIQLRVAQFLNLAIEPAPPFVVTVGNGDSLKCLGQTITLQGEDATKPTSVSYHQLRQLAQTDGIAWAQLVAISLVQAKEASNPVVHLVA